MPTKIDAQLNFFGPLIKPDDFEQLVKTDNLQWKYVREDLGFFFGVPYESLSQEILARYVEATTNESYMYVVPHTEEIFQRMLSPLKSAKKNYAFGEYIATIALSGLVGEMLSVLMWKMNPMAINGKQITEAQEEGLFGYNIERMDHSRRIKVLKTLGRLNDKQSSELNALKNIRKEFLHFWNPKRIDEKAEALNAFFIAMRLFKNITGVELADAGSIKADPRFLKYISELKKTATLF